MWIKPDVILSLAELVEDVTTALEKFRADKKNGTLKPVDDEDRSNWL
jgi:hypothetical protein